MAICRRRILDGWWKSGGVLSEADPGRLMEAWGRFVRGGSWTVDGRVGAICQRRILGG